MTLAMVIPIREGDWAILGKEKLPADNPKRTNEVTESVVEFLEDQAKRGNPFFMQVSYYAVHVSYDAQESTIEKYRNLPRGKYCVDADYETPPPTNNDWMLMYAAMTEELYRGLSSILDKLEELNMDEDTYVIYVSDNGACFRGNRPLSGGKGNIWEGGIRVPTVVMGPKVKKGSYCDIPIAGWDFYATINDIIGGDPLPPEYDGGSLLNVFERGNRGRIERSTPELIFHFPWYGHTMPASAIVDGNMKLIINLHTGETKLFDLVKDIAEQHDLSMKYPKRSAELKAKLEAYLMDVEAESLEAMYEARVEQIDGEVKRARSEEHKAQILRKYDWIDESKANTSWRYDFMEAFNWEKYNATDPSYPN